MPLILNGMVLDKLPPNTRVLFQTYPHYKDTASALCAQPPKVIGPIGLLYVTQREYAIAVPHDKNVTILGTADATTCHMIVLRHSGSGAVCLAHFDGSGIDECIPDIIRKLQELSIGYPEGQLELHMVGGFEDMRGYSEGLCYTLLECFHKQLVQIELVTACLGEMNSTIRGGIHWPIIYGLGVNVKTGELFAANFPEKGPDISLRSARYLTGSQQQRHVLDIYDYTLGLLRIGPFNYEPLRGVDLWLQQSDDFILQHLSTSPEVEPPHFVMEVRSALKHIQEHPFPAITIFPDNRPRFYRKDESGAWIPVRY